MVFLFENSVFWVVFFMLDSKNIFFCKFLKKVDKKWHFSGFTGNSRILKSEKPWFFVFFQNFGDSEISNFRFNFDTYKLGGSLLFAISFRKDFRLHLGRENNPLNFRKFTFRCLRFFSNPKCDESAWELAWKQAFGRDKQKFKKFPRPYGCWHTVLISSFITNFWTSVSRNQSSNPWDGWRLHCSPQTAHQRSPCGSGFLGQFTQIVTEKQSVQTFGKLKIYWSSINFKAFGGLECIRIAPKCILNSFSALQNVRKRIKPSFLPNQTSESVL